MKKIFKLFVLAFSFLSIAGIGLTSCGSEATMDAAKEWLWASYKNSSSDTKTATAADYTLDSVIRIAGVDFKVTWSLKESNLSNVELVSNDSGQSINIVDVFSKTAEEYTLVAKIEWSDKAPLFQDKDATLEFERVYPKFEEVDWATWASKVDAEVSVTIKGHVIGIIGTGSSKGSMYVQDATGHGYYCYNPAFTDEEKTNDAYLTKYAAGKEVYVTGTVTKYNGQLEFNKNCTVQLTGGADSIVAPKDVTSIWQSAHDSKDEATLKELQNSLVSIDNCILTSINGYYYYFASGNAKFNVYDNAYFITAAQQTAWKNKFTAGKQAKITGIVSVYSNVYQIYPISENVLTDVVAPTLSDTEIQSLAKNVLAIEETQYYPHKVELPTKSDVSSKVSVTWEMFEASDYATVSNTSGKYYLNILDYESEQTVKIRATFHVNGLNDVMRSYAIKLALSDKKTCAEFLEIEYDANDSTVYAVEGWVVAAGCSGTTSTDTTGSFAIMDATGALFSYNKAIVEQGSYVRVYATRGLNSGVDQLGTLAVIKLEDKAGNPYDKANAIEIDGSSLDLSKLNSESIKNYTNKLVKVTGLYLNANGTYFNGYKNGSTSQVASLYLGYAAPTVDFIGHPVDIYGICRGCSTGKYITIQVSEFVDATVAAATDAEKVAWEKNVYNAVKFNTFKSSAASQSVKVAGSYYNDVAISYSFDKAYVSFDTATNEIKIADFSLVTADEKVKITVTFTKGDATVATDFNVNVENPAPKVTLDFTSKYSALATSKTGVVTIDSMEYNVANCKNSDAYLMMYANNAGTFFCNKTAVNGRITKVTVVSTASCSDEAVYYVDIFSSAKEAAFTSTVTAKGKNQTLVRTATATENCSYFGVSIAASKNGQIVSIVVEYEPAN